MTCEAACLALLLTLICARTPAPEPLAPEPVVDRRPAEPVLEPPAITDDGSDRSTRAIPPSDCWIFKTANPRGNCRPEVDRGPRIGFDREGLATDAETKASVEALARMLAEVDEAVEIGVGMQSKGSDEFNLRISQARAEALVAALEAHGVAGDRMVAVGHGEGRPVIANEGCDLSERVDVRRLDGPCEP